MSRVVAPRPDGAAPKRTPRPKPGPATTRQFDPLAEPQAAAAWAMPNRPSRGRLFWRRTRARLRPLVLMLLVVGAVSAAAVGLQRFGQGGNLPERIANLGGRFGLVVTDIKIEGRDKTPLAAIAEALKIRKGQPILAFSVSAARDRLEKINWVQSAAIRRQLPNTVVVQITERRPNAVYQKDGRFVLIDRAGDVVTDSAVEAFEGELLLVVGDGADKAAAGLIELLRNEPLLMPRIAAAQWIGKRRWNLQMKNGTEVLLPEGAERLALAKLVELQGSIALLDRPLKQIDLRLPDRLTVRAAGDASATKPIPPAPTSQTGRKT